MCVNYTPFLRLWCVIEDFFNRLEQGATLNHSFAYGENFAVCPIIAIHPNPIFREIGSWAITLTFLLLLFLFFYCNGQQNTGLWTFLKFWNKINFTPMIFLDDLTDHIKPQASPFFTWKLRRKKRREQFIQIFFVNNCYFDCWLLFDIVMSLRIDL